MAGLNKVLNILIFLLAGASVFFGFQLFKKREELRKRGDKMARFIIDISRTLDEGTGTNYQKNLVFKRLEVEKGKPGYNPNNAKVSLWHNNYNHLSSVLEPVKEQTVKVVAERDQLANTLSQLAANLEVPNADEFPADKFMDIKTYNDKDTQLAEIAKKIAARDNALVAQIADSADVMGQSIETSALLNLDDYSTPLSDFGSMVKKLKERSDTYASSIKEVCDIFGISSPSLDGDDYTAALDTVKTEMQGQKDDLDQTKADLESTKEKLTAANDKIENQVKEIAGLNLKVKDLKEKLANFVDVTKPQDEKELNLKLKLEGKVVRVNKKWGFVVINLGQNNKMIVGLKEKSTKTVPLEEDVTMDVARGPKFMGKIHIVKVAENCAIGDIIPESTTGEIKPGDKVFFARANKVKNQDKVETKDGDYDL